MQIIANKAGRMLLIAALFIVFFNGYSGEGPSKKKFKVLGESEMDLTKEEIAPEVNNLKSLLGDRRLKEWAKWWQKCASHFTLDSMEDIGQAPLYDEHIDPLSSGQIGDGPGRMFYLRSPDGKSYANPHFRRMLFKKEGDAWQPCIELPCGVALYKPAEKWARNILDCSALEGIDDGYWQGKDRLVLMGYTSVSRHMNVECDTVESCVSPTVWIIDIKSGSINEHRGAMARRNSCDLGGYLKLKHPQFFGKEK